MKRILTSLIAVLAITNLEAQQKAPKLVVCITVDQLRGDYIQYFQSYFGQRGFKRLFNEGLVYDNVLFEFSNLNEGSTMATLFTGSNPNYNGITTAQWYDIEKKKEVSALNDPEYLGNFTSENLSPKNLLSSTIGDELKIASRGNSDVYSIAPNAISAIISAGHAANGAFWIDDYKGKWATTTYYKNVPWYVEKYNNSNESLATRAETMTWSPALPLEQYNAFCYSATEAPFKYSFNSKIANRFLNYKTSALVNDEVTTLAKRFLEFGGLGKRTCPDYLAVTYYAGNYRKALDKDYSIEIQDTYRKLDQNIESLLDAIDKSVGLANTLVVFTGNGYYHTEEDPTQSIANGAGEFHPKRCKALLNMYLMATYGQGDWVKEFNDNQIFLNRKLAEDKKLNLAELQRKAADFVQQFTGIQQVVTSYELQNGDWNQMSANMLNGTHHLKRGDLLIELQPGWRINYEEFNKANNIVKNYAVPTPLVLLGSGIKAEQTRREIKATEVAPTVTHILRIRAPNACKKLPLREVSNYR
ncbi:MAG: alkaline phosphatase family protein [Tannerellaceae bacterium]